MQAAFRLTIYTEAETPAILRGLDDLQRIKRL
jgi:hypothetical protein